LVVTAAPSYDIVTAELDRKVLPETAIVEPASPVVGLSDIDGSADDEPVSSAAISLDKYDGRVS